MNIRKVFWRGAPVAMARGSAWYSSLMFVCGCSGLGCVDLERFLFHRACMRARVRMCVWCMLHAFYRALGFSV